MVFVVLGLGSNKAFCGMSPLELLKKACVLLKPFFTDFTFSSVYSTKPMYVADQDDFLNMAVAGFIDEEMFSPQELLKGIHEIEESLGRKRENEIRNGPRSMDIDIELWGNKKIFVLDKDDPMKNLQVPHPRLAERAFVLIPLLEISDESADSIQREVLLSALSKTGSGGVEKKIDRSVFLDKTELV